MMQNKQQEIEIKIKIDDDNLNALKSWLNENADFDQEYHQVDYYLENPNDRFTFEKDGFIDSIEYLRIRISDKGDSTCFKHWYEDPKRPGYHTHCDEFETKVESGEDLLEIYKAIGYTEQTIVDKKREKYFYKDFEIVIDDVKDLGIFVEIEVRSYKDDPKGTHKILREFIKEIGIKEYSMQRRGYVSMLWNGVKEF